jgi:DNA-binding transcriptional regulator YdaS (Cro superfamily)
MLLSMRCINRVIEIVGSQTAVAKKLGVTQGAVSQWSLGKTAIGVEYYEGLALMSGGEITPEEFLKDELLRQRAERRNHAADSHAAKM